MRLFSQYETLHTYITAASATFSVFYLHLHYCTPFLIKNQYHLQKIHIPFTQEAFIHLDIAIHII